MFDLHEDLTPVRLPDDAVGFVPVVRIGGELDIATAPRVHGPLQEAARAASPCMVIDLTELTFCGSAGLAQLLAAQQEVQRRGGHVVLVGCRPEVVRLLRLADVLELFVLTDTMPETVAETMREEAADVTTDDRRRFPHARDASDPLADPDHR